MKYLRLSVNVFVLVISFNAVAEKTLTFATGAKDPLHKKNQKGFLNRVANEAFRRIGYKLYTIYLPSERALLNANAGIEDGDLNRIAGLQKIYPNLIQVPEPIMVREFTIFTKKPILKLNGWASLMPYTVGYIVGWKIAEKNIKNTQEIVRVKNPLALFTLLNNNRVDVVFFERWMGLYVIKKNQFKNIRIVEPALVKKPMHIYLNKKHRHLVPEISRALINMKKDGTYQRLYKETLGSFQ